MAGTANDAMRIAQAEAQKEAEGIRRRRGDRLPLDQGDHEPVIALAADSLDRRRNDAILGGDGLVQLALGEHFRIVALRICECALADHVVGDDQGAGTGVL